MEVFYEAHQDEIANDLADAVQIALEDMMSGAPPTDIPFAAGTARIGENFKKFLDTQEVERMGIPGVPTGAAKRGVSHRLKHPYAKRDARPSFIDTGQYEAAMTAWVE